MTEGRLSAWPLLAPALALLLLALGAGAAEWAWTAALLAQQRSALGQPWLRMVLILGTVALLTLGAAVVMRLPAVRHRYRQA